jgi:sorbitol-specific phosphotransferase system component IIBC
MYNSLDTVLIFAILSFFQFWGGAAIGAGVRDRRLLAVVWGILIGGAPLYFGIERVVKLGSWAALAWQIGCLVISALAVGLGLPRVRAFFLKEGMASLMIGTFIMALGAVLGAWLLRRNAEAWSLIAGGLCFMFGAMWFGAGLGQLRGK